MKVSVIIPIYNVEAFLDGCLQSVLNQTYRNIELILVDDASTDSSLKIASRFFAQNQGKCGFEICLIKHSYNKGVSAARNSGIDAVTGDYLYFLDSDDEITPDCIATLVEPLKKQLYDMVIGNYEWNRDFPNKWQLRLKEGEWKSNKRIFHEYCSQQLFVMSWNKLCRRSFIIENQLFFLPGIRHEDALWSFSVALHIDSLYVVRQTTYHYLVRPTSYTRLEGMPKEINNYITIVALMLKFISCRNDYDAVDIYHHFDDIFQSRYIGSFICQMENEYRILRKMDIRPYCYILKRCLGSMWYFRSHGHRLLPPYMAYRVYNYIIRPLIKCFKLVVTLQPFQR